MQIPSHLQCAKPPAHAVTGRQVLRHDALSDVDHAYALGREYLAKEMPPLAPVLQALDRQGGPPRDLPSGRPRIGTEDWYGVEILETLFTLRGRMRKRELESARNLPQFRVAVVCAELFEDYREDVRSKLIQAGCSKVSPPPPPLAARPPLVARPQPRLGCTAGRLPSRVPCLPQPL